MGRKGWDEGLSGSETTRFDHQATGQCPCRDAALVHKCLAIKQDDGYPVRIS